MLGGKEEKDWRAWAKDWRWDKSTRGWSSFGQWGGNVQAQEEERGTVIRCWIMEGPEWWPPSGAQQEGFWAANPASQPFKCLKRLNCKYIHFLCRHVIWKGSFCPNLEQTGGFKRLHSVCDFNCPCFLHKTWELFSLLCNRVSFVFGRFSQGSVVSTFLKPSR